MQSQDDFPLLALSKKANPPIISLGSGSDIEVKVINMGLQPAYDIELVDRLRNGTEIRKTVDVLAGMESYSMIYTVVPEELGDYDTGTAIGEYNMEQGNDATRIIASSNWIREETSFYMGEGKDDTRFRGNLTVVSAREYRELHAGWLLNAICYAFMGVIPALFPYVFFRMKRTEEDVFLKRAKSTK